MFETVIDHRGASLGKIAWNVAVVALCFFAIELSVGEGMHRALKIPLTMGLFLFVEGTRHTVWSYVTKRREFENPYRSDAPLDDRIR